MRVRSLGVHDSEHDVVATKRVGDEGNEVRGAAGPVPVLFDPLCGDLELISSSSSLTGGEKRSDSPIAGVLESAEVGKGSEARAAGFIPLAAAS